MATIDILLLLALSAIWGGSFIFIRYLAPLIGPVATADMRMLIAGIFLVLFFLFIRFKPGWRKNGKHFLVIGLLNSAIPFLLYSIAALFLPASMEAIFNSLSPMFGALVLRPLAERTADDSKDGRAPAWHRRRGGGEQPRRSAVDPGNGAGGHRVSSRARLLRAGGCVHQEKTAGVKPMAIAGGSQLFGGLAMLPFLLVAPPSAASISLSVVLLVILFAVACSAVAYLIYYRLIADIGPTKALTVTFLIPVFTMAWGLLLLHEAVTLSMAAGAAVILLGTFLVTAPRRKLLAARKDPSYL